ncbi:hypothetical protein [Paenibacillus terrae]|uniref:hypothetical protein n=1 Tax=Paenibacillus terrae TaxID=159743 RepID=UPI0006961EDC|nr:hypothetical protein [Paenibacillus terrae]
MGKGENRPEGIVGTSEFAAVVGKTKQWIGQLTRDGVLTQVSRGKYDLAASIQAYIRHVTGATEEGKISFADEKAQHEQIKKQIAMLELEEKRNNLHTTADVQHAWGVLLVNFRERLTGLPPKLAGELSYMNDEPEIRRLLEDRIEEALFILAKYDPLAGDDQ